MTAYLNLSDLDRAQLENLLLTVHSAYLRTLQAVRDNAKPEWRVRRDVEEIADEIARTTTFKRAFARYEASRNVKQDRARNDRLWSSLPKVP